MRYRDPHTIFSPKDLIEIIEVIFDGGPNSYSVAKINWEEDPCIGIRWNISMREWHDPRKVNGQMECVGMPQSHGYPTWFNLPAEFIDSDELYELKEDLDIGAIHMLVSPGGGIGAIADNRRTGLAELRKFTKDAQELIIIDPYVCTTPFANIPQYLTDFKKTTRINGGTLEKLHLIYNPNNAANEIKKGLKKLASDHSCTISSFATTEIHDRIWIKNKSEAIMVGTSFGGIGNKLCFITNLAGGDFEDLMNFLQSNKMLTNSFV